MIYLVNQGKTFRYEHNGGYIWSPKLNSAGYANQGYSLMMNVRKGDYIIHNSGRMLSAISVVQEDCKSGKQPTELKFGQNDYDWDDDGWMVKTKYYDFDVPLLTSDLLTWAQNNYMKDSAFQVNGKLRLQYLCNLATPHALFLLEKALRLQKSPEVVHILQEAINKFSPSHPKRLGEFGPWNIMRMDVAIRKTDSSFFEFNGFFLPKEIKWFFDCDNIQHDHAMAITLEKQGKQYPGHITNDAYSIIMWSPDLTQEFKKYYHSELGKSPLIRFQRITSDLYHVDCLEDELITTENNNPLETVVIPQKEGKKKEFFVTKYERNPTNRKNAILIHGTRCMACGFDFEAFYGEAGKNYIEVHHTKPLSDIGEEISIDPEKDLVCVCSNCHRIIHKKKNGVYSLEEVRAMIEAARKK